MIYPLKNFSVTLEEVWKKKSLKMDSGSEIDFNDIPEYDSGIFTAFLKHFYMFCYIYMLKIWKLLIEISINPFFLH